MISAARPLAAGNAVRLYLTPPAGAVAWRVLRKAGAAATIPTHTDPKAVALADTDEQSILDWTGLVNGTAYTWRAFYRFADGTWQASAPMAATPAATYGDASVDVQELLRERIGAGLVVEVQRGALKPAHGKIPVHTAPFQAVQEAILPCVSVHFDTSQPANHSVGEEFGVAQDEEGGDWTGFEGWLERVRLTIAAVSLNGDERKALRRAVGRILMANLEVMAAAGITTPEWSWTDMEQLPDEKANAPLFFANATFNCVAPAAVTEQFAPVRDAVAIPHPYNMEPFDGQE